MAKIDEVFETELTIRLSDGGEIELKEYNVAGISTNQTVALLPSNKGLVVGDLVHHNAHAWLEGGINNGSASPELQSWINLLKTIRSVYKNRIKVFGGRGESVKLEKAISDQIAYLEKADEIVETYIYSVVDKKELLNEKAQEHYKKLSELFKKEFPEYKLNYMIDYGIYGLVNSKL